jgi:hypothetical protein
MRYVPEIPWGRFAEDGSRSGFRHRNRATETGSPDDSQYGDSSCCDHDPWQDMGRMSEATAILVAAAIHQAA